MNYLMIRLELMEKLNEVSSDIPFKEENVGGDIWRIYFENSSKQFTIEVNLEYTEFYWLKGYMSFHAVEDNYISKVVEWFKTLLVL